MPHALLVAVDDDTLEWMSEIVQERFQVTTADCIWSAVQHAKRTDITWSLIVVRHPMISLAGKIEKSKETWEFCARHNHDSGRGGIALLKEIQPLGLRPEFGILCGYSNYPEDLSTQIAALGGRPIIDDDIGKELRRLCRR